MKERSPISTCRAADEAQTASSTRYAVNLVRDAQNRILLLKREPGATLGAGLWGLPAGHIEEGETPLQCANREMEEETGLRDLPVLAHVGPVRDRSCGGAFEVDIFLRAWTGGEVRLNHEHTAYAWVGPEDYHRYAVMPGVDEDLAHLGLWGRSIAPAAEGSA